MHIHIYIYKLKYILFFGSLVLPSRGERLFQGFNHWPGEPFPSRISWADSILFWGIRRPMIHYTSSHQSMGSVKNGCISNSTVVTFQAVLAIFYWTMIRGERVPFKKFNLFSPWMFSSRRVPPTWCCPMCHGHQLFRHHLQCFFFWNGLGSWWKWTVEGGGMQYSQTMEKLGEKKDTLNLQCVCIYKYVYIYLYI